LSYHEISLLPLSQAFEKLLRFDLPSLSFAHHFLFALRNHFLFAVIPFFFSGSALPSRESRFHPLSPGNKQTTMGGVFSKRQDQARSAPIHTATAAPTTSLSANYHRKEQETMGGVLSRSQDQVRSAPTHDTSATTTPSRPNEIVPVTTVLLKDSSIPLPPPPSTIPIPSFDLVEPIEEPFSSLSLACVEQGVLVYTIRVTFQRVCFFVPSSLKLLDVKRIDVSLPDIEENSLYLVSAVTPKYIGTFSKLSEPRKYTARTSFVYDSPSTYRQLILPALLLGCRIRDFEQRCATVTQLDVGLVLSMPSPKNRSPKTLTLKTLDGDAFDVDVNFVQKGDEDKRCIVACHPSPLPVSVPKGCLLEVVRGMPHQLRQQPVTGALVECCLKKDAPIDNWPLLECIYGQPGQHVFPATQPAISVLQWAKGGDIHLNAAQSEALACYNSISVPAFVIEAPPGSGKTLTAAAMAASYEGEGVQLFLSTANVPVLNIAQKLAEIDFGSRRPIHLISAFFEFEDKMKEENRSPFSSLALAKNQERLRVEIERLEADLKLAPNEEERKKVQVEIRKTCGCVLDEEHDIYFATLDTILNRYFKANKGGRHIVDVVKKQLHHQVSRVIIDEASQLTEAALNALIICFPKAQIVLI
ncbi:hypothetical protein PMAYCL1PPCAC_33135, partial [Pristionchus mayeri]